MVFLLISILWWDSWGKGHSVEINEEKWLRPREGQPRRNVLVFGQELTSGRGSEFCRHRVTWVPVDWVGLRGAWWAICISARFFKIYIFEKQSWALIVTGTALLPWNLLAKKHDVRFGKLHKPNGSCYYFRWENDRGNTERLWPDH